ncbi:MAG: hypothetical protein HY270_02420 [Deltaproteobacteria bacterium]|nr:hypothetical protein [Deltaproteobacteria bacterium]
MTSTPAPFLAAQITTDRGCIETGNNATYAVGETLRIFYRVDGYSGQAIPEAQVSILDFPPNSQGMLIFSGATPTGQTFSSAAGVSPPLGTETLVIQAQAAGLSDQSQCSFHVIQLGCMTACDCPTEQSCNMQGQCESGLSPVYCCEHGPCPIGAICQHIGGNFMNCPGP